ncbi:hypothetical protein LLG95_17715 [bacterium]|nr:hypothetical protein [bacterium]
MVLLLAAMMPLMLWRNALESSLWCDEIYSVLIAEKPAAQAIDQTSIDCHPPGYYLSLKGWVALGRAAGIDPGVSWGRLPGVIGWLGLVAAAYFLGRAVFGRSAAMLLAWAVAIAAQTAFVAKDMRPYAMAYPALFTCFMLLLALRSRRRQAGGWMLYAACAAVALWSHMLSGPVLGLLAIMWLAMGVGLHGTRRKQYLIGGFIAQAAALISFLPWLVQLAASVAHLANNQSWMTPPTVRNWLLVFGLWYPIGRHGGEGAWGLNLATQVALGAATLALPAAALVWAKLRQRRHVPPRWKRLAAWGIGLAVANVTLLWGLNRTGTLLVFHGPRFLVFTAAMWICGLVGLGQWARIRAGWRPWTAWALMVPWFVASAFGIAMDLKIETHQGLAAALGPMPPAGSPLYVMPTELMPFQRRTLARWNARPIERIAGIPAGTDRVSVLIMNQWQTLNTERDWVVLRMLRSGRLAQASFPHFIPPNVNQGDLDYFTLIDAQGWNHHFARQLGADGFRAKEPAAPARAMARIDPRDLRMRDGWHFMQVDADLQDYRWSAVPKTKIQLPRELKPGRYVLHLNVVRAPMFSATTRLGVEPPGRNPPYFAQLTNGLSYHVTTEFQIRAGVRNPVVTLVHPVADANRGKAGQPWMIGIALYDIWLE